VMVEDEFRYAPFRKFEAGAAITFETQP